MNPSQESYSNGSIVASNKDKIYKFDSTHHKFMIDTDGKIVDSPSSEWGTKFTPFTFKGVTTRGTYYMRYAQELAEAEAIKNSKAIQNAKNAGLPQFNPVEWSKKFSAEAKRQENSRQANRAIREGESVTEQAMHGSFGGGSRKRTKKLKRKSRRR